MTNLESIKNSETQCKILEYIARKGRATPQEIAKANIRGLQDLGHEETVQQIEAILGTGFLIKIGGIGWFSVYEVPEWVRDPIIGALYQVQQLREREILAKKKSRLVKEKKVLRDERGRLAKERLKVESQIESVHRLLESAEQTLSYWKEQYDRFQKKKQWREKRRFLERELAWAEVAKREKIVEELKDVIEKQKTELSRVEDETKSKSQKLNEKTASFEAARTRSEIRDVASLIIEIRISLALLQYQKESVIKKRKKWKKGSKQRILNWIKL